MPSFNHTFDLGIFGEYTTRVEYFINRSYLATRYEPECPAELEIEPIIYQLREGITIDLTVLMTPEAYASLEEACFDDNTECAISAAAERHQAKLDAEEY